MKNDGDHGLLSHLAEDTCTFQGAQPKSSTLENGDVSGDERGHCLANRGIHASRGSGF